jgi:DNA-binding transcriptional LysR family regulator
MTEVLTVGVVPGVSADKWTRIWQERLPDVPLRIVQLPEDEAAAALGAGVDMVFARLPVAGGADLHVIPLWDEVPVVVAAKDHPIKVFDAVTLAELEDEDLHPGADEATLDLVAAGHGTARMPQSVYRATGRRDLVAREITDAPRTRIALVWPRSGTDALTDEFVGIVRGRTTNSSRGAAPPPPEPPKPATPARARPARPARRAPARRKGRR